MTLVIDTQGLGRRYRRRWALTDCTLSVPAGQVVGLVGPNGAGKSTLLHLVCGQVSPSAGTIRVLGRRPGAGSDHLARVGFVAQDTPLYRGLSVADHLRFGARMNRVWDHEAARRRIDRLGLHPQQRAGSLSGGQRAQLALALAAAKQPDLLLLDEPVAALDPLARSSFLEDLTHVAQEHPGRTTVLSSHVVTDLERVCDHLILLSHSHVQLAGPCAELIGRHYRIATPAGAQAPPPSGATVIHEHRGDRRRTLIVEAAGSVPRGHLDGEYPHPDLEELVLAYMARDSNAREVPQHPGAAPHSPRPATPDGTHDRENS